MKKLVAGLVIFIIILIALTYILIPGTITINQSHTFQTNEKALFRTLSSAANWAQWWKGKYNAADKKLILNNNTYSIPDYTATSISIDVNTSATPVKSMILFVPLESDSLRLEWQAQVATSYNPFKRLQLYFAASGLQHDFNAILHSIPAYYTNDEKIYGLNIRRESVPDTSLVFTFDSTNSYPSNEKVYSLIDELRAYVKLHSAVVTDSPMLNIYSSDGSLYITKVALPTNKILPSSGKIFYKWMLPHGNILVADVTGDKSKTDSAFAIMENYVHDYGLAAPAIPFFKLISNRLQEKDSSRWKTRIYYPVMYYK